MSLRPILQIGRGVKCINLPTAAKLKIEKDLTFDNPEYLSAIEHGRFISADMPAKLELFDKENGNYWIPRGYIYFINKWLFQNKYKVIIDDRTLLLPPIDINFKSDKKLLPYQLVAAKDMLSYPVGVLEGSTGSGKTVIGIGIICERKQPTLIIVHSKLLLYQWQEEIEKFTGYKTGLLGDDYKILKPITIGIINSVNNNLDEVRDQFGQVACDECHKVSASTWADSIQDFPAKHYLGLTATAFRRDGLGNAIFASLGPLKHKIDKKMLLETKAVLTPDIYRIRTNFYYNFLNDYSTMIKELTLNYSRNRLICRNIAADLKRFDEHIVIVSDRKEHCKEIGRMLSEEFGILNLVLTGNVVNKKQRAFITNQVKTGQCKVLVATLSLIGEGFDAAYLTALFLLTPVKFAGRLLQGIGRILRPPKDKRIKKTPRVYDFRDEKINVLLWSGYSRDKVYRKEWNR